MRIDKTHYPLPILIRAAVPADLPEILQIYTYHVLNGFGTFEEMPPTIEQMKERTELALRYGLPYWVAESEHRLMGFAYAGPYHSRSAYRYTSQVSVYARHDMMGNGVGRALLQQVMREAEAMGYRQMLALVGDSSNAQAIRLFTRSGFRYCGQQVGVGYKFGRWLDVVTMQRTLAEGTRSAAGAGAALRKPIP